MLLNRLILTLIMILSIHTQAMLSAIPEEGDGGVRTIKRRTPGGAASVGAGSSATSVMSMRLLMEKDEQIKHLTRVLQETTKRLEEEKANKKSKKKKKSHKKRDREATVDGDKEARAQAADAGDESSRVDSHDAEIESLHKQVSVLSSAKAKADEQLKMEFKRKLKSFLRIFGELFKSEVAAGEAAKSPLIPYFTKLEKVDYTPENSALLTRSNEHLSGTLRMFFELSGAYACYIGNYVEDFLRGHIMLSVDIYAQEKFEAFCNKMGPPPSRLSLMRRAERLSNLSAKKDIEKACASLEVAHQTISPSLEEVIILLHKISHHQRLLIKLTEAQLTTLFNYYQHHRFDDQDSFRQQLRGLVKPINRVNFTIKQACDSKNAKIKRLNLQKNKLVGLFINIIKTFKKLLDGDKPSPGDMNQFIHHMQVMTGNLIMGLSKENAAELIKKFQPRGLRAQPVSEVAPHQPTASLSEVIAAGSGDVLHNSTWCHDARCVATVLVDRIATPPRKGRREDASGGGGGGGGSGGCAAEAEEAVGGVGSGGGAHAEKSKGSAVRVLQIPAPPRARNKTTPAASDDGEPRDAGPDSGAGADQSGAGRLAAEPAADAGDAAATATQAAAAAAE